MKPLKYTVAALALIAVASFTQSAMAASTGDLIFGAYDTNTPSDPSFELDLGSFSTLGNGESWNLGTTVTTLYSTDSSPAVIWNVAASGGTTGGGSLAANEVAITAVTLPTPGSTSSTESTAVGDVISGYSAGTALTTGVLVANNSGDSSFADEFTTSGGGYGFGAGYSDTFPSTDDVTLYAITQGGTRTHPSTSVAADGYFVLSNVSGSEVLTYDTAASVPEPSAYALGLCAAVLFWVLARRRSVA